MEQNKIFQPTEPLENKNEAALGLSQDEKDCLDCNFSCIQGCV